MKVDTIQNKAKKENRLPIKRIVSMKIRQLVQGTIQGSLKEEDGGQKVEWLKKVKNMTCFPIKLTKSSTCTDEEAHQSPSRRNVKKLQSVTSEPKFLKPENWLALGLVFML